MSRSSWTRLLRSLIKTNSLTAPILERNFCSYCATSVTLPEFRRNSYIHWNRICKYGCIQPLHLRYSTTPEKKICSPESPPQKESLFQRFKSMYRDYWYVLVPVHIVTSLGWFGTFYYLAKSGVDLASLAQSLNLSDSIVQKLHEGRSSTTGYLALSYLLYKIATPVRYTVTLGGTTISINYLKKWGAIKPIPKREDLKKMIDSKRVSLKEKRDSVKQNLNKFRQRKS